MFIRFIRTFQQPYLYLSIYGPKALFYIIWGSNVYYPTAAVTDFPFYTVQTVHLSTYKHSDPNYFFRSSTISLSSRTYLRYESLLFFMLSRKSALYVYYRMYLWYEFLLFFTLSRISALHVYYFSAFYPISTSSHAPQNFSSSLAYRSLRKYHPSYFYIFQCSPVYLFFFHRLLTPQCFFLLSVVSCISTSDFCISTPPTWS